MNKTRIAVLLLLGIMLTSGLACGGPQSPNIVVERLTVEPAQVQVGEWVTATTLVVNTGGAGTLTITLKCSEAGPTIKKNIAVETGETKEVTLGSWQVNSVGSHTATADGATVTYIVIER